MYSETDDAENTTDLAPQHQRERALELAARFGTGIVTLVTSDPARDRSYPNSYVLPGQEYRITVGG